MELVIVLVILAAVTMTVLPQYRHSFTQIHFAQVESTITSQLRYARHRAVARRESIQFVTRRDDDPTPFLLERLEVDTGRWVPLPGALGRTRYLPEDVTLEVLWPDGQEKSGQMVIFTPNGFADGAQLVLRKDDASPIVMTIDAATGHVEVKTNAPTP
jgi:hypothetical protein